LGAEKRREIQLGRTTLGRLFGLLVFEFQDHSFAGRFGRPHMRHAVDAMSDIVIIGRTIELNNSEAHVANLVRMDLLSFADQ
jgi:hypothetical protein